MSNFRRRLALVNVAGTFTNQSAPTQEGGPMNISKIASYRALLFDIKAYAGVAINSRGFNFASLQVQ